MAVATPCLRFPHPPTTTTTTTTAIMSTLKVPSNDAVLLFRSTFLGYRTRYHEFQSKQMNFSSGSSVRRLCSASFENSSSNDEEFSKKIEELGFKFQLSDENFTQLNFGVSDDDDDDDDEEEKEAHQSSSLMEVQSIEMIKRKKKQWQENFIEAKENAYCSVKKAFSSMVFIIRELHSYTLQMREVLFYEDLQGILARVQTEIHASFVWLFQQVFSHTPTLMIYVMILLANFSVDSISNSAAIAAAVNPPAATVQQTEAFSFKTTTMSSSSSSAKTTSVGGNDGGGNNVKPVGSGMDGDSPIVSDEIKLWKAVVDEASRMRSEVIRDHEALDDETLQRFVSPVTAKIEDDEYQDYSKTEIVYQTGLAQEPNNVLLLANYAQFLYLVVHDFDRAEDYFKRAVKVEPKDAEAYNKYAIFLWQVRNDLWAAEETFLEAISADPSNSYYAANYAHFLWNTGGEDTCFPLDSPDDETLDS